MKKAINICIAVAMSVMALSLTNCKGEETKTAVAPQKETIEIDTALRSKLQKFATKPRCKGAFGLYVYDLTAGKEVFGDQEHQPQPSASCMKLLSGMTALHMLGTGYEYHSGVYINGKTDGDTLRGDIGFKGDLDPQLTAEEVRDMAHILKMKRGLKSFTGKFYIDILMTEQIQPEEHWFPYDLTLSKFSILYRGKDFVERTLKTAFRQEGIRFNDEIGRAHV